MDNKKMEESEQKSQSLLGINKRVFFNISGIKKLLNIKIL